MDLFTTLMRPVLLLPETHTNAGIQILMVETLETEIIPTAEPLESTTIIGPSNLSNLFNLFNQADLSGLFSALTDPIDLTDLSEKVQL